MPARAPQGELIAAQSMRSSSATARPTPRPSRSAPASGSRGTSAPTRIVRSAPARPRAAAVRRGRLADVDAQPDVRLAVAREAIAATEADLARAAKKPDWSAELTYAVRGSPYSNMVSLMVSIDLPWSPGTRQDREHAAKLKELDAARAMREDTRRMRVAEVDAMLAEWESARARRSGSRTSCSRSPRSAARPRSPPIAAARARWRPCSTRAAASSTPASRAPAGTGGREGLGLAAVRRPTTEKS